MHDQFLLYVAPAAIIVYRNVSPDMKESCLRLRESG